MKANEVDTVLPFDSIEPLRKMLFESLEADGFRCIMGLPIHNNERGQEYRLCCHIMPLGKCSTKDEVVAYFKGLVIANFTQQKSDLISLNPRVYQGARFDFTNPIEFRAIDFGVHGVMRDHAFFYLRAVARDESLPIKWKYNSEGEIERADNESSEAGD